MHIVAGNDARYFCIKKGTLMMTREEIISIERYCAEHNVSHKDRLTELEISPWRYFAAKRKYREDDKFRSSQKGKLTPARYNINITNSRIKE